MRKLAILGASLLCCALQGFSQSDHYYYYKNKKLELALDLTTINIVADSSFEPSSISHLGFKPFEIIASTESGEVEKLAILEYQTEPNLTLFNSVLDSLYANPAIRNVNLYFQRSGAKPIGTSIFFT